MMAVSFPAVAATASRRVQQAAGLLLSLSGGRQLIDHGRAEIQAGPPKSGRSSQMTIRLGVVMDPIAGLNYRKDSTLALLWAAQDRG